MTAPNSTLSTFEIDIGYAVFLPVLIIVTTIMNSGTIVAFWKLPSLREKPSEMLILNLACSDLPTGSVVLPLASPLYITPSRWPFGEIGCTIWNFFIDVSNHGTLFVLLAISLDRFLLVFLEYPQYVKNVTKSRIYKLITAGWIFAILTAVVEMAFWQKAKDLDETARTIDHTRYCLSPPRRVQSFALSFFLILYLFPVIMVLGLSILFLYQLRLRLNKAKSQRSPTNGSSPSPIKKGVSDLKSQYIKPGVTLIGLVSAMAICMLPYSFYVIIIESGCEQCNDLKLIYDLLLMQFCNACLDPFIYVLTRKRMRKFYYSSLIYWRRRASGTH